MQAASPRLRQKRAVRLQENRRLERRERLDAKSSPQRETTKRCLKYESEESELLALEGQKREQEVQAMEERQHKDTKSQRRPSAKNIPPGTRASIPRGWTN